eukprot:scaffold226963_cov20-Prasinocladus_malaysianus.AAC.1
MYAWLHAADEVLVPKTKLLWGNRATQLSPDAFLHRQGIILLSLLFHGVTHNKRVSVRDHDGLCKTQYRSSVQTTNIEYYALYCVGVAKDLNYRALKHISAIVRPTPCNAFFIMRSDISSY